MLKVWVASHLDRFTAHLMRGDAMYQPGVQGYSLGSHRGDDPRESLGCVVHYGRRSS